MPSFYSGDQAENLPQIQKRKKPDVSVIPLDWIVSLHRGTQRRNTLFYITFQKQISVCYCFICRPIFILMITSFFSSFFLH